MPLTPRSGSLVRWRWLLPAVLVVGLFHLSPLRDAFDRACFDHASRNPARAVLPPDGSAIVMFDQAAMAALSEQGLGTWPPPRVTFAALIAGLERAGAARIVLDFVFLDHSSAGEQDALLGSLAAGLPNVVLARTAKQTPIFWDEAFVGEHPALFTSPRMGLAESVADSDGVLRHYPWPRSLAQSALGAPSSELGIGLLRWLGGLEQLRAHPDRVPVLSAGRFVLAGLPLVERVTERAADFAPEALARELGREPPLTGPGFDDVRGRIVFVGANAEGTFDQKPFPIGGVEPGVLLHWTAWANFVDGRFVRELPAWSSLVLGLVVVAALAGSSLLRTGLRVPVLVALSLGAAALVASYVGHSSGWFLQPATPVAAAIAGLLGVVAEKFWSEQQRRREVQTMFGSYVAPEIVNLLVHDPTAIRLGGEKREATVFFCDLAGFTDLSEQVSPEELLELVNGYLQETSECLMEHGAYVDKYIGDAVMAVFGVPQPLAEHALAAGRAALAVQRLLAERNRGLAAANRRTLSLRVGLNSGAMIVGNVGSERKRNYTVLGDAVNLASRLEGANKAFGTRILVGNTTAQLIGDRLVLRPLTSLRVKGKHVAVPVFELLGAPEEITAEQRGFLLAYTTAHALYTGRQFSEAADAFARAAALDPSDLMTGKLLAECQRLALLPPGPDWQPIISLETK